MKVTWSYKKQKGIFFDWFANFGGDESKMFYKPLKKLLINGGWRENEEIARILNSIETTEELEDFVNELENRGG